MLIFYVYPSLVPSIKIDDAEEDRFPSLAFGPKVEPVPVPENLFAIREMELDRGEMMRHFRRDESKRPRFPPEKKK